MEQGINKKKNKKNLKYHAQCTYKETNCARLHYTLVE